MKWQKLTRRELVRRFNDLRTEIQRVQDFGLPCTNFDDLKMELLAVGDALAAKQYLSTKNANRTHELT